MDLFGSLVVRVNVDHLFRSNLVHFVAIDVNLTTKTFFNSHVNVMFNVVINCEHNQEFEFNKGVEHGDKINMFNFFTTGNYVRI